MRVTLDSNAWETIFDPDNLDCEPLRVAMASGVLEGYICESAFRIEAINKGGRTEYFQHPKMDVGIDVEFGTDGRITLHMQMGPADQKHPGLPKIQSEKIARAIQSGVRLLHGISWMGLPSPAEINDPALYVKDADGDRGRRDRCQADVAFAIGQRGVGRSAFETAGGWSGRETSPNARKKFQRACAEWADGETVIAHIAYQNDVLCTNDHGRSAGASIFDLTNRAWLTETYGVRFATLQQLIALFSVQPESIHAVLPTEC
ncbi:MAG: hypothetical protein KDJ29_05045 [Hyphomicrobiales bacterium]|nr:hypothetical protein [Hyphomicrobiales bacterium]